VSGLLVGMRVLTARGPVAVEDLRTGDRVAAFHEGVVLLHPVVRVDHATVHVGACGAPEVCAPVRVRAGVLGAGQPRRDLWLGPGSAIVVEGSLVAAAALVDGDRIVRETWWPVAAYYRLALAGPGAVLVEGVVAVLAG
jgi:hypothetical protein